MKTNVFNWLLMAALVMGLGICVTSCSDDDDEKKDNRTEEQKAQEAEQAREAFWSVVGQLIDIDDYTADYQGKTFEPTIGEPDAANPLVRVVAVNDMATAAKNFADLVNAKIDENTTSYEYKHDAVGTLTYTKTNDGRNLATVDVNIKQVPKLQQIRFVNPQENDENGLFIFSGTAYYRFGDVISRYNEDQKKEYWVCVRPCFSKEDKSNSYWISLSPLPAKNVYSYTYKGKTWNLPTGLKKNTVQMQNFAELLYAMMMSYDWYYNLTENQNAPKFFNDFKVKNIQYHNQWFFNKVYAAWDREGMFETIFNMDDRALWKQISSGGLRLLYNGYSWWTSISWNCNLFEACYRNGINATANMHLEALTEPKRSMENISFDVNTLYSSTTMPLVNQEFFGDQEPRWIIRVATGKELASNGKEKEQQKLEGCTDEYRYNRYFYGKDLDLKEEPEVTNAGKKRSNIGRIVSEDMYLWNTIQECENAHRLPIAMVVYDIKDLDVDDKAGGIFKLHRFSTENLLCISLVPSPEPLAWGDNGNDCGVKRYDIDGNDWSKMMTDISGWLSTKDVMDHIKNTGHKHTAFEKAWNYWGYTNIYPFYTEFSGFKQGTVTNWYLPSPAEWRLFLKGMHAWVCSYDGKQVEERIKAVYHAAGIKDATFNFGERDYSAESLIPLNNSFWTSTDASTDKAYTLHIDKEWGARFEKTSKSNAHLVYPFVIMQEVRPYKEGQK